jgi:hypothetical protein
MTYILIDQPLPQLHITPSQHIFIWPAPYRLVITLGKDITSLPRVNEVWDCSIGWHFKPGEEWSDEWHTPYVRPENVGYSHSKITFRRRVAGLGEKLSTIIAKAPREDRPGGNRGGSGRPRRDTRPVKLMLTREQKETFVRLGGQTYIYELLDKAARDWNNF